MRRLAHVFMNSDEGAFLRNVSQGCLLSFLFLRTVVFGGFGQLADVRLWSNAGTVLILRDLIPMEWGSRNSVGIGIQLSDSEEEKLFVHDSMQVSPE